jgi:ATP-binding cassette, subfamily B, bacterial
MTGRFRAMSGGFGRGAAAGRPSSRDLKPLAALLPLVVRYRGHLALALVSLVAATAATLVVPVAVRRIIDHGFSNAHPGFINQYFAVMLVVVAVLAVASAGRFYFVSWLGERAVADLRDKVFAHLLTLSPGFYDTAMTGEVMSRLTADTLQIKSMFSASASIALRNSLMLIGAVAMMLVTSLRLSGLVLLAIPLIVLPLVLFGREVRRLSREAQDALAGSAALAQESLANVQAVQAVCQEPRFRQQFAEATERSFLAARGRSLARALLTGAIIFIAAGAVVGILWLGAQDVLTGRLTGGTLSQFVIYAALAASALGSLSEVWGEVQLSAGAAERLLELTATEPLIRAPAAPQPLPEPPRGAVAFRDVHFSYPSRSGHSALNGLSFSVAPGERVAIVGPSGAGKTTIFNLLLRFYDVVLDGVDVRNARPADIRSRIALVPQDVQLFSASILDNIRFARPDASEEEVRRAAAAARVTDFAERLPQGFATMTGERGITLSGGQRQRIAIARALLRNPPVLLLDEATSALDAESENLVQAALQKLMRGRTTLVIAHRLATVRDADRILVLDHGRLTAEGSHDLLMSGDGLYRRLARLQFQAA